MIRLHLSDKERTGLLGWLERMAKEKGLKLGPFVRSLLISHPEVMARFQKEIEEWKS